MDRITQTIVNPKYDGGAVNTSFIRYRYIDIIKGFTILWVISMHLEINPPFIDAAAQMGIFFFSQECFIIQRISEFLLQTNLELLLFLCLSFGVFLFS